MSPREVSAYFSEHDVAGSQHVFESEGREIHYAMSGDTTMALVVFLHGSPGSLSAFIHFLTDSALLTRANLLTTDRPGFGYSDYGKGEPSLKKQCQILAPVIEKHKRDRPVILVGHSLSGALVACMAIERPELVDGIIIVAGSIDPELEPNQLWFRAPLATPFLRWVLPGSFRASNDEIYKLKPQLQQMVPQWSKITCPVIVIHGGNDKLVPYGNVDFARKMLVNASVQYVLVDSINHFVPWSNPKLITDAVVKMLDADLNN